MHIDIVACNNIPLDESDLKDEALPERKSDSESPRNDTDLAVTHSEFLGWKLPN